MQIVKIYSFKDKKTEIVVFRVWEVNQEAAENKFKKELPPITTDSPLIEISSEPAPARRVVCAANRHKKTKRIICGPRHWDATMRAQILPEEKHFDFDQGFVDQYGLWMTREEAFLVAQDQGQIFRRCGGDEGYLFSENLY